MRQLGHGYMNVIRYAGMIVALAWVLAACSPTGAIDDSASVMAAPERMSWGDYIASLQVDDFGSYRTDASNAIESVDRSYQIGIEARYYPEDSVTRFVVYQNHLQDHPSEMAEIEGFSFYLSGSPELTELISMEPVSVAQLIESDQTYTTALPFRPLNADSAAELCGHLDITFVAEDRVPFNLKACGMFVEPLEPASG